MPTVLRESGFRFIINTDDYEPMHVHVRHQGSILIVEFADEVVTRNNYGFNRREERQALIIVGENQIFLQTEWRRIYGQN